MNRIPEIAHMLGLEIGEEFFIKGCIDDFRFKFTEEDVGYFSDDTWVSILCFLGNLLNGKWELVKIPKSILTEEEKEYLSYVIKPFRDEIEYIHKFTCPNSKKEYLMGFIKDIGYHLELPPFIKGTMYCGIELGKEYTLEELGL